MNILRLTYIYQENFVYKFEKIKIDRRALEFSKYYFIKDQRKDDCPCVII